MQNFVATNASLVMIWTSIIPGIIVLFDRPPLSMRTGKESQMKATLFSYTENLLLFHTGSGSKYPGNVPGGS